MLMLWCLVLAQLLSLANSQHVTSADDIDVSHEEIFQPRFETQAEKKSLGKNSDTPQLKCDSKQRYSNINGTCNNLNKPSLGSANTAFQRVAAPDYANGLSEPRRAHDHSDLPNARRISYTLFGLEDNFSPSRSVLVMSWGQFTDHDITLSAEGHSCKGACVDLSKECFGITIPADDPYYPKIGVDCITVRRNAPAPNKETDKPREQSNILTAFIDASQVYDVDEKATDFLRDTTTGQGLMKESLNPSSPFHGLLPTGPKEFCRSKAHHLCFKTGDVRANDNQGLTTLHLLAVREHNRIATQLKTINPMWNGDKIFYETRKIVAAQQQHITYNEYLPQILDQSIIQKYGLKLEETGFYRGYSSSVDPSIINAFAAAALRFGHSQVPDVISRYSGGCKRSGVCVPWNNNQFFNPDAQYDVSKGGVDGLLRGIFTDHAQAVDRNFAKAIHQELVRLPEDPQEQADLPAINIQRARERGVPGYNTFRSYCGLHKATKFEHFESEIPPAVVDKMKTLYKHPDDADLYVGGILETQVGTGAVGPTFSCLIAEQFRRLRSGDRFWYENGSDVGFNDAQLQELRKVSLARRICDNSDHINNIPVNVMSLNSVQKSCKELPSMDLTKWKADQ